MPMREHPSGKTCFGLMICVCWGAGCPHHRAQRNAEHDLAAGARWIFVLIKPGTQNGSGLCRHSGPAHIVLNQSVLLYDGQVRSNAGSNGRTVMGANPYQVQGLKTPLDSASWLD